jgi:hypothetical protein
MFCLIRIGFNSGPEWIQRLGQCGSGRVLMIKKKLIVFDPKITSTYP